MSPEVWIFPSLKNLKIFKKERIYSRLLVLFLFSLNWFNRTVRYQWFDCDMNKMRFLSTIHKIWGKFTKIWLKCWKNSRHDFIPLFNCNTHWFCCFAPLFLYYTIVLHKEIDSNKGNVSLQDMNIVSIKLISFFSFVQTLSECLIWVKNTEKCLIRCYICRYVYAFD